MKIAVVGKGGAGKTTIAGTLSRILGHEGNSILAIDGDHNPNLALTLGLTRNDADQIQYIPSNVMKLEDSPSGERVLVMNIDQDELFKKYATPAPDNVNLIVMGRPAHGTAGSG